MNARVKMTYFQSQVNLIKINLKKYLNLNILGIMK